jgi:glutamate receptor, ionotropic, invertebrate
VSDTDFIHSNFSAVTPLIEEGNNIAFIYNFTRAGDECVTGLSCHSNELLKSFVLGLSKAIRDENAVYGQISDEEWEIIRPSKRQRRDDILEFMNENLDQVAKCSNCTAWNVKTAEIWGDRYTSAYMNDGAISQRNLKDVSSSKLMEQGLWKATGLVMRDVLFPHVSHGFRGKTFHIITYHVSRG